jgi:acetyl-CoA carboxylase biotin carboxyl carrier protein
VLVPSSPAATHSTTVEHPGAIKAPMVGTAYLAPQPGEPPFVRLGDSVAEGQPLLIIEAMKVMNQIRAHRPGRVAQILVADAQPVEYGAVLMLIE